GFLIDRSFEAPRVMTARKHLTVPPDGVQGTPGAEIEHGHIPVNPQLNHRSPQQVRHYVVTGKSTHRARKLAGHDRAMRAVDQAGSHIPGSEYVRQAGDPHEWI